MNKEEVKNAFGEYVTERTYKNYMSPNIIPEYYYTIRMPLTVAYELIDLIKEMETPTIPYFVAEWIEECKEKNKTLSQAYSDLNDENVNVIKWLYHEGDRNEKTNLFALAWLYNDYIVEEKRYYIRAGEHYIKINLDGTIVGVKKKNSIVTKERLDKLPFDVDKAVESKIIKLEEVR